MCNVKKMNKYILHSIAIKNDITRIWLIYIQQIDVCLKYNRWPLVLLDNINDSTLVEENFSCMDNSW